MFRGRREIPESWHSYLSYLCPFFLLHLNYSKNAILHKTFEIYQTGQFILYHRQRIISHLITAKKFEFDCQNLRKIITRSKSYLFFTLSCNKHTKPKATKRTDNADKISYYNVQLVSAMIFCAVTFRNLIAKKLIRSSKVLLSSQGVENMNWCPPHPPPQKKERQLLD